MSDRELKLNTLSEYSKDSPHLVREEYGNCEVPAGCGGVVLRWRNPNQGVPVPIRLFLAGQGQAFLDGAELTLGRPIIPCGEHILALELSGADPRYLILLCGAVYRESDKDGILRSHPTGEHASVLSAADGTWKFTKEPPAGPGWRQLDFDDSGWSAMVRNAERPPLADPKAYDADAWRIKWITDLGAVPLGIPNPETGPWERLKSLVGRPAAPESVRLWVRKRFAITPPEEASRG